MTPARLCHILDMLWQHLLLGQETVGGVIGLDRRNLRRCMAGSRVVPPEAAQWLESAAEFLEQNPAPGRDRAPIGERQ